MASPSLQSSCVTPPQAPNMRPPQGDSRAGSAPPNQDHPEPPGHNMGQEQSYPQQPQIVPTEQRTFGLDCTLVEEFRRLQSVRKTVLSKMPFVGMILLSIDNRPPRRVRITAEDYSIVIELGGRPDTLEVPPASSTGRMGNNNTLIISRRDSMVFHTLEMVFETADHRDTFMRFLGPLPPDPESSSSSDASSPLSNNDSGRGSSSTGD